VCFRGCEYNWYIMEEDGFGWYDVRENLGAKQNKAFSEDELLVHLENCPSARMLWEEYMLKGKAFSESGRSIRFRM
jgi:hypothetical protein